jgi:hypothetical protein
LWQDGSTDSFWQQCGEISLVISNGCGTDRLVTILYSTDGRYFSPDQIFSLVKEIITINANISGLIICGKMDQLMVIS